MIRSPLVRTLLASAALSAAIMLSGCNSDGVLPMSEKAARPLPAKLVADIESKNMDKEAPILVRLYKEESELEVWKQDTTGHFAILKVYPICRWSGDLGPKVNEGDRQAPEGFYKITPALMNPNSNYYLAINIGFPNAFDKANDRHGGFLEFVSHFEAFGTEVWRGIVIRKNTTRANDTNYEAIVMHATWLHDMLKSKRQRSNLSLEEFRAAGITSLLHLAVDFDTAIVKDFKAEASDPGERLDRIAGRVGIAANPNARALFEMAPAFSKLLRFIELGQIRDAASAERLCRLSPLCDWTAKVINLYSETTGRDLRVRRTEVVALPVQPRIQRRFLALQALN